MIENKKKKEIIPPSFIQPQMRFTSKFNIERIIEIYSRNDTKNASKLLNFINFNQGEDVKSSPKKEGFSEETEEANQEGTKSYEEMKREKDVQKEYERRLQNQANKQRVNLKTNKYYEHKKNLNEEAANLLKDNIVKSLFKGVSESLSLGNNIY